MENKVVKPHKTSKNQKHCFCKSSRINYQCSIVSWHQQNLTKSEKIFCPPPALLYSSTHILCRRMCHEKIPVILKNTIAQGQPQRKTLRMHSSRIFAKKDNNILISVCEESNYGPRNAIMA